MSIKEYYEQIYQYIRQLRWNTVFERRKLPNITLKTEIGLYLLNKLSL